MPLPDFTAFNPGYEEKNKKEAERRKTLFRNHRSLAGCGTPPPSREGEHAFRRSTAALARGTHASQRLSFGPGFTGQTPKAAGFTPPAPAPLAASTSRAGPNAGRHDVRAAREQR